MALALRFEVSDERAVQWARGMLLAGVVAMLVSTSAAVIIEYATYVLFALSPALRARIVALRNHPVMPAFLLFLFVIVASAFHGPASWWDALVALEGWHRALLLPLALAAFDDEASKRLALKTLLVASLVGVAVSFVTASTGIVITETIRGGIAFRNYTVQGLTFTIAMIVAIAALLRPEAFAGDRFLGNRPAMAAVVALMAVDIVFVLWGRSAYVAVLVMGAVTVVLLARGSWRIKALAGVAILAVGGLLLASSPTTRARIAQGVEEIATVDSAPASSSFGQRVVMWRNAVKIIADHPVFGVGTGGFLAAYRSYVNDVPGWHGFHTGDPHNQFMKFQAEQGIFGLAAVLFFIFRVLTCPGTRPYRQLAVAIMLGWCATSLANAHFSTFVESRLLFFWLGVLLAGAAVLRNDAKATI